MFGWAKVGIPLTELERFMVMVDQTTLVLFALGALGLLGIFLLFQRIRRAARVNRILKTGNRILQAGGNLADGGKTADQKFVEKLLTADARLARENPGRGKATEQTFRNVFAFAADRGEGLIEHYMTRHKCGRIEAMKRAIEEREREGRTYG
jgi:hypothetical protein